MCLVPIQEILGKIHLLFFGVHELSFSMGHVQVIMDEWTWYHYTRSAEHKTRGECMQTSKQANLEHNGKQQMENKRKSWLNEAQGLITLLFIWGAEWVFSALIDF